MEKSKMPRLFWKALEHRIKITDTTGSEMELEAKNFNLTIFASR